MPTKSDSQTTIQELKDLVIKFRDDRGFGKQHSGKNLAITICLEAAELLEHYQWDENAEDKKKLADELSDILFNVLNFADVNSIDLSTAFYDKFQRVVEKYPVEVFNEKRDSTEEYKLIKKKYRQNKQ